MNTAVEPLPGAEAVSVPRSPSLSFVVTSVTGTSKLRKTLDLFGAAARNGDEIVVLAATGSEEDHAECGRIGARLVTVRGTSIFGLRACLPAVARKEWLVLVEDHALPEPQAIAALRNIVGRNPKLEIVPFLGVNRVSTGPWGWANFLQTMALFWVPLSQPPPFCLTTNVAIRRDVIGTDRALRLGQWEFELVARIFARGKVAWSDDIAIDHEKHVGALAACLRHYRNGRSSAAITRKLGLPRRALMREARKVMTGRLAANRALVEPRLSELPRGTMRRLAVLAAAHAFGCVVGTWLGAGRALTKID